MGEAKRKQQTGACKFCGQIGNLSQEHILPLWLDGVFPERTQGNTYSRIKTTLFSSTDSVILQPEMPTTKPGVFRNRKVRHFCKLCNGGWMGDIQEAAKPLLEPAILGQAFRYTQSDLTVISTWAIMTSITNEWADTTNMAISPAQRVAFFESQKPSQDWLVSIGRIKNPELETRITHHALTAILTPGPLLERKIQASAIQVGELVISTLSVDHMSVYPYIAGDFSAACTKYGSHIIWPVPAATVQNEDLSPLSQEDFNSFAYWIHDSKMLKPLSVPNIPNRSFTVPRPHVARKS